MTGYAKVIADSIAPDGTRLTTMEVRFHRFVLAEFNTHRVFSRNSASSRAIPLRKQAEKVWSDLASPLEWPAEQKGMQGGDSLPVDTQAMAHTEWTLARDSAMRSALALGGLGVHKSVANRLLEPFMWHTVVVTATAWDNFFLQRCSPLAQPEIRVAAEMMRDAMEASTPRKIHDGEWHLPYAADDPVACEYAASHTPDKDVDAFYRLLAQISAARCAGVSYESQGSADRNPERDAQVVYPRLTTAQPAHWSPLEHVATPWAWNRQEGCIHFGQTEHDDEDTFSCMPLDHLPRIGNLLAWRSLRTTVETEMEIATYV